MPSGHFIRQLFSAGSACLLVLSFSVCAQPDFSGTWSGPMTTQDNAYWNMEDFLCFPGCPQLMHDHLKSLLEDPANDDTPTDALMGQTFGVVIADRMARSTDEGKQRIEETTATEDVDMAMFCEPYGFVREALNALPMQISQRDGHLVIRYEEFNLERIIYMDGRAHPEDVELSPLGFSTGRFEDGDLVIETSGLEGDHLVGLNSPTVHYGGYADGASAIERYSLGNDPRRLEVALTLTDPVTLKEPYTWTRTWLNTPQVTLMEDSCEEVPGVSE